ncbi:MAG: hypothetical protein ACO39X_06520 [Candidatus Nanopelagicaceae bacterium]
MTAIYIALITYLILFSFTWVFMYRLVTEVCDDIYRSLMHEIGMRKLAGDDLDFQKLQSLVDHLVNTFRAYSIRGSVLQNTWMCFGIVAFPFSDSGDFEETFKAEFKATALAGFMEEIQNSGNPLLEEFRDILHAASLKD